MQAALPPPILQELMDRQQFEVVLQAQAGGRIVARETLKAYRKNVLAKCYGGDVSRWARPGPLWLLVHWRVAGAQPVSVHLIPPAPG